MTTSDHDGLYDRWVEMQTRWYGRGFPPGRNDVPQCLADLYNARAFDNVDGISDAHLLAVAVESTWSDAEYPEAYLDDADLWVGMFTEAGEHLSIPDEPVTLYRGVREDFTARRMSWTGTLDVARWFADRYGEQEGASGGLVYRLTGVEPEYVLAKIVHGRGEEGRGEDEYVLDPFYLDDAPIELFEDRRKAT